MKIIIIFMVLFLMACTTIQREYIKTSNIPDPVYLEVSGFAGMVIGVGITSLSWYMYEQLK